MSRKLMVLIVLVLTFGAAGFARADLLLLTSELPENGFVIDDLLIDMIDNNDENFCGQLRNNQFLPLEVTVSVNDPVFEDVFVKKAAGSYFLIEDGEPEVITGSGVLKQYVNLKKSHYFMIYPEQKWETNFNDSIRAVLISENDVVELYENEDLTGSNRMIDGKDLKKKSRNCYTNLKWGDMSGDFCCVDLRGSDLYEEVTVIAISR